MAEGKVLRGKVGFAGLGSMGFGMASHLLREGYQVTGFDVYQPTLEKFQAIGGATSCSPKGAARGSNVFICMTANSDQAQSVLFGTDGAVDALPTGAVVVLCSTVPPAAIQEIQEKLRQRGRTDISLLDCPVSGGTARAALGTLTIMVAGSPEALDKGNAILSDISEKLYVIPGGIGAASNVKMINQLLVGVHIAAAAEAMGLAAKAGLNTRQVYDIITNAAGNSWAFENRVPHMLDNDWNPLSALNIFVKDMGIVTSTGRLHGFPLPLASAAEQLYISGSSQGLGLEHDAGVVRTYIPTTPSLVHEQARPVSDGAHLTPSVTPTEIAKIGFVGMGAMGQGMAASLLRAGFTVHGYDVYEPSVQKFISGGGKASAAKSPSEAAQNAQVLLLMVQNAAQADDVLFGAGDAAEALPADSIIILSSTVPPSFVRSLGDRLTAMGKNISLVDAPVSGGVVRAAKGDLTIICSGADNALEHVKSVLTAMSGLPKNLCYVQGGIGAASSVKLINQLLAGIHIAAAAEAMAFSARLGLDTRNVFEIVKNAAGWSWMLENRVPAMLDADWTPHSALAIFVKDMGIVLDEAKRLLYPATMSAAAHQLYLACHSHGLTKEADSGVVRFWELMTGVSVSKSAGPKETKEQMAFQPRNYPALPAKETIESLPPPYSGDVISAIRNHVESDSTPVLVVLDDDPTGTQTCHDIAVLTVWDPDTLRAEFEATKSGFFILTNSRALPPKEAKALILEICKNVAKAAEAASKPFEIVLRGDSTLRGHIPEEPEAAEEALGRFDGWIIAPFFFQGGRYTIDDVHYVKEGDELVPASETPFAKDATFGYKSSNLRDYILEKAGHRFTEHDFLSVTLTDIRAGGPDEVTKKLLEAPKGKVIIVNAAAESDMYVFAAGLLAAEKAGKRYLYRSGAALVSARLGISGIPPLTMQDLGVKPEENPNGGLIVAGSYVPKTTAQLKTLRERRGNKLRTIELDVEQLISSQDSADQAVSSAIQQATQLLSGGEDVLVMTSRKLITGADALSSLSIGSSVAAALVKIVQGIEVRPRYIIAKGGITSSDAATKGLRIKRAMILGQAAPGVPLWRCDEPTSRHVGVPYVVFPGNVGSEETLAEVVERWAV
ncbi:hypothetical protein W97_09128 [Coniosporium apollinis CBS 100218]|uniref:3-hydroxyisobutyrate dehydrogenase n=1 Tax=Coniosporium apollinis (strain CBS 100218) TaxID=1168221 RepID=R7Z6P5_CONA1|nr:uncharacterized protein W97_09128 [Coniosporium apollinis CBS 100218]EON69865.1 hypothetical protein W97_09128 [Coniosporium apollinis CBS 100218]